MDPLEEVIEKEIEESKRINRRSNRIALIPTTIMSVGHYFLMKKTIEADPETFYAKWLPEEVWTFGSAAVAALGTFYVAKALSKRGLSRMLTAVKTFYYRHRDQEKYVECLKEYQKKQTDPFEQRLCDAQIHFLEGRIDHALEEYRVLFAIGKKNKGSSFDVLERLTEKGGAVLEKMTLKKTPESVSDFLNMGFARLIEQDEERSLWFFDKASGIKGDEQGEVNCLYAFALEVMGKESEARKQWVRTIDLLLQRGVEFQRIGDSRNEVLEIRSHNFFRDTFVFKRDSGDMEKDFVVNSALYKSWQEYAGGSDAVKLAQSLRLMQFGNRAYHISKRKPFANIAQAIESNESIESGLNGIVENEAMVHWLGSQLIVEEDGRQYIESGDLRVELKTYDYQKKLKERLIDRVGRPHWAELLEMDYARVLAKMGPAFHGFIHGDASLNNGLTDGTLLDFETASIGNPTLDVVATIEDPRVPVNRDTLKKRYVDRAEKLAQNTMDRMQFERWYLFDEMHQALCHVGSQLLLGNKKLARAYGKRAQELTKEADRKLYTSFVRYIGHAGLLD